MSQANLREFTGKTLDEAIESASVALGIAKDQLQVEVLAQPGGLSSLFGKKARIAVRETEDAPLAELKFSGVPAGSFDPVDALARMVTVVVPTAKVEAIESEDELRLDIAADGSGIFIGRKGATLEALQFLMTRMAQKQGWQGKRVIVDSEGYRERRVDALRDKTRALAERVQATGRPLRTELLDASMRKVVHSEIKAFGRLRTRSIGEGELKRVQIAPADGRDGRERR